MNKEIEKTLMNGDYESAYRLIQEYRSQKYDYDTFSYLSYYYTGIGKYDKAYDVSCEAVDINPFSIDSCYNLASAAWQLEKYDEAYKYLLRVHYLQEYYKNYVVDNELVKTQIEELEAIAANDEELSEKYAAIKELEVYSERNPYKSADTPIVGQFMHGCDGRINYVASTSRWYESYYNKDCNRDACRAKCELFPLAKVSNVYKADISEKSLMPVCINYRMDGENGAIADAADISKTTYMEPAYLKYSYIPVDKPTTFVAASEAVFAKPIPLNNSNGRRKRLVMSIFADSFNYRSIKEKGLDKLMPETAAFFEKGIVFDNFYSGSEWTLPSIATYWTGKHSSKHMNLDEKYLIDFMKDEKVLAEYFHDEGYVTAKIGGNDAVTPVSGYNRGIDRFLYQYISQGYTAKDVVTDVIEHMRTFAGDDQYLWVDFVDLHDISGGFMRSIGVQAQMPLECRMFDNDVKTTVKQTYSENRKYIFEQELREFDFHLGRLFKYIEDNYSDDEIVISLFSDHGAAFMVDNGEPFVSWQRMNVPMMIRGTGGIRGVCDEVVESADYAAMMCALAGIKYDYTGTDANLPKVLGGTREREYALSQSLFVGDLYSGALHGRDFHYYYKSAQPVQPEFRIDISKAEDYIADDRGEIIDDDDRRLKYRERLLSEIKHLIKK